MKDILAFWIASGSLLLLTVIVLIKPLMRRNYLTYKGLDTHTSAMLVYKNQLLEIEHDVWRGLLEEEQIDDMQLEIYRRILCIKTAQPYSNINYQNQIQWFPILSIGTLVPVGTICIYLLIGSSSLPDRPILKIRDEASQIEYLVHKLAQYMRKNSTGKVEGWLLLARSQRSLGHYIMAAQSFHMAIQSGAIDADTLASYGEMLVISQNGQVSPEAVFFFRCAYLENHRDPRIAFYLGLNALQEGYPSQAIALWRWMEINTLTLPNVSKTRWHENLQMHIEATSKRNKLSPLAIAPLSPADIIISNHGCAVGEYAP